MGFFKSLNNLINAIHSAAKEPKEYKPKQLVTDQTRTTGLTLHQEPVLQPESKPFHIDLDFNLSTHRILKDSSLEQSLIVALAQLMTEYNGHPTKKLASLTYDLFVGQDFDWPWYETWLERFRKDGFPKIQHWDSFASEKDWLNITIWDVLKSLKKEELLTLAKEKNITTAKDIKVTELREKLNQRLKRADIKEQIIQAEILANTKLTKRRLQDKYELLVHSIAFLAQNLYRHQQVSELLDGSIFKYKISAEASFSDKIASRIAKSWKFDKHSTENLPPFFPGDHTGIRTQCLK